MTQSATMIYRKDGSLSLREAVVIFDENIDEIIEAVSLNIKDKKEEHEALHTEVLSFLDTDKQIELATEVHSIVIQNETQEMAHSLKALVRHKNAKNTSQSQHSITDTDIARAKEYPIQDLYIGKLRKQGSKFWGTCAFHVEKSASFVIDTRRNNWRCFGACGTGGDSIAFYAKMHNLDMRKDFTKIIRALV